MEELGKVFLPSLDQIVPAEMSKHGRNSKVWVRAANILNLSLFSTKRCWWPVSSCSSWGRSPAVPPLGV